MIKKWFFKKYGSDIYGCIHNAIMDLRIKRQLVTGPDVAIVNLKRVDEDLLIEAVIL